MRYRLVIPVLTTILIATSLSIAQADSGISIVAVGDIARAGGRAADRRAGQAAT